MRIVSIQVYRLSQPLIEPYHLSYRSITELDSVWVKVQLDNDSIGWGESTPLPGYSESDIDGVWAVTNKFASSEIGKDVHEVIALPPSGQDGFLFSALWTALEEAAGNFPVRVGKVPLVGLVQEREGELPGKAIQRVRQFGYKVFKIKVGFLPSKEDVQRLTEFQNELLEGECIRIDANQSLTEDRAAELLTHCMPGKIELFEQPLPVDAWEECARLARKSPVPIMLDESITDLDSLERTAQSGAAKIVKLKLMKQGSMGFLLKMVERARKLNLRVVFGNGVAGSIDNRHEAIFWIDQLQDMHLAGEMNGYLKLNNDHTFLGFDDGNLNIQSMQIEDIDPECYRITETQSYSI